jgi:nitronate monooxygenase
MSTPVSNEPARRGDAALAPALRSALRLPVIAGPMFLVSGPELVIASSRAGIVGSFPTLNARTPALLDEWLARIGAALAETPGAAPFAANLIVHRTNVRADEDLEAVVRHKVPIIIASVGSPAPVVARVKAYGGLVFADVASLRHAHRALDAGVDGLILLAAGAGGNTGWMNPFAFVTAVREFFAGPIALGGALSRGRLIRVAETLGADFGYLGTHFIAARESMANDAYREMLVASCADDIVLTDSVTGIPANMLRPSLERAGFTASGARPAAFDLTHELETLRAWRDIWSAGHGVGDVKGVAHLAEIVEALRADYLRAA